ncbi:MAG: hypothetical protein AAGN46_08985 [Acidobacteriota bacterium]
MKNLILFVFEPKSGKKKKKKKKKKKRLSFETVERLLSLQIDNSLELGWAKNDLLVYTNFPFRHAGVTAIEIEPPERPRTARATSFHKTFCLRLALDRLAHDEVLWYHDVDAFQLVPFEPPSERPLAYCLYSARERLLVQGGSLFARRSAQPVFDYVWHRLTEGRCRKDEFALTDAAAQAEFVDFFDLLDGSYNLGTTDFALRWQLAERPIRVVHFHPERGAHREVFIDRRNAFGVDPLDARFRALLDRHGFDGQPSPAKQRKESSSAKLGAFGLLG